MHVLKKIGIAVMLSLPAAASALETTEDIVWPEEGRYPAYPQERDERPVQFSVSGGYYHDDNVFRLSDNAPLPTGITEKSDNIYRLGLGLRADLPISRQRVLIDAQVNNYAYDRYSGLDHVDYRAGAAWRWVAGQRLSGELSYGQRRYLADLGEIQAPIKDLITEDRAIASGGFRVTPRWRVRGAAEYRQWDHSEPTRSSLDLETTVWTIGLDYVTPANNSVGGQFRYVNGDYKNRQTVGSIPVVNDFDEYETSAVLHWILTGRSVFDARLGYTKREHDQVPERDFDGFTGRVTLTYEAGAKTLIAGSAWREIRSVEEIGTLEQAAASYVLATGASIGPSWAPTSKLVFELKAVYERREYAGDPGPAFNVFPGAPGVEREDTFNGIRIAAGYTPRRNLKFSLAAERGDRESNILFRDYDYTRISANASFQF